MLVSLGIWVVLYIHVPFRELQISNMMIHVAFFLKGGRFMNQVSACLCVALRSGLGSSPRVLQRLPGSSFGSARFHHSWSSKWPKVGTIIDFIPRSRYYVYIWNLGKTIMTTVSNLHWLSRCRFDPQAVDPKKQSNHRRPMHDVI